MRELRKMRCDSGYQQGAELTDAERAAEYLREILPDKVAKRDEKGWRIPSARNLKKKPRTASANTKHLAKKRANKGIKKEQIREALRQEAKCHPWSKDGKPIPFDQFEAQCRDHYSFDAIVEYWNSNMEFTEYNEYRSQSWKPDVELSEEEWPVASDLPFEEAEKEFDAWNLLNSAAAPPLKGTVCTDPPDAQPVKEFLETADKSITDRKPLSPEPKRRPKREDVPRFASKIKRPKTEPPAEVPEQGPPPDENAEADKTQDASVDSSSEKEVEYPEGLREPAAQSRDLFGLVKTEIVRQDTTRDHDPTALWSELMGASDQIPELDQDPLDVENNVRDEPDMSHLGAAPVVTSEIPAEPLGEDFWDLEILRDGEEPPPTSDEVLIDTKKLVHWERSVLMCKRTYYEYYEPAKKAIQAFPQTERPISFQSMEDYLVYQGVPEVHFKLNPVVEVEALIPTPGKWYKMDIVSLQSNSTSNLRDTEAKDMSLAYHATSITNVTSVLANSLMPGPNTITSKYEVYLERSERIACCGGYIPHLPILNKGSPHYNPDTVWGCIFEALCDRSQGSTKNNQWQQPQGTFDIINVYFHALPFSQIWDEKPYRSYPGRFKVFLPYLDALKDTPDFFEAKTPNKGSVSESLVRLKEKSESAAAPVDDPSAGQPQEPETVPGTDEHRLKFGRKAVEAAQTLEELNQLEAKFKEHEARVKGEKKLKISVPNPHDLPDDHPSKKIIFGDGKCEWCFANLGGLQMYCRACHKNMHLACYEKHIEKPALSHQEKACVGNTPDNFPTRRSMHGTVKGPGGQLDEALAHGMLKSAFDFSRASENPTASSSGGAHPKQPAEASPTIGDLRKYCTHEELEAGAHKGFTLQQLADGEHRKKKEAKIEPVVDLDFQDDIPDFRDDNDFWPSNGHIDHDSGIIGPLPKPKAPPMPPPGWENRQPAPPPGYLAHLKPRVWSTASDGSPVKAPAPVISPTQASEAIAKARQAMLATPEAKAKAAIGRAKAAEVRAANLPKPKVPRRTSYRKDKHGEEPAEASDWDRE